MKKIISLVLILTLCILSLSACSLLPEGKDGKSGKSAFLLAKANGFIGTEEEWVRQLSGKDGKKGESPEISKKGNWVIDGKDTGVSVAGEEKSVELTSSAPLAGKTIVTFGDSITGKGTGEGTDIATYLAQFTGATVYNCGFGGCRMTSYLPRQQWDAFSMYQIARAITSRDFSYQEASFSFDDGGTTFPTYFRTHYERLKSIDFNEVDIITIAYGTNDLTATRLKPNENFTLDFKGALRYSIEKIQEAYPHINIYLCTPIYRAWTDAENNHAFINDSDTKVYGGYKLTDYVQAIKDVGDEYHLPVIDLYYELGINRQNRLNYFPKTDGTHPNALGRYTMAKFMAEKIF